MTYQPSRRERILIYGGFKAGKSMTYIGIMEFARLTKTDAKFYIIDNDNATEGIGLYPGGTHGNLLGEERGPIELPWVVERSGEDREGVTYGEEYENAIIWKPENFDEYPAINKYIRANVQPNDWVVVDMASNIWETMPDWWIENVYGSNTWDYYANVRAAIERGPEEDGDDSAAKGRSFGGHSGVDWQYIGKMYRKWEKELSTFSKCHFVAYSAETEIQAHHDKTGERRAQFAMAGNFAPKVEKNMPHRVHTILRLSKVHSKNGRDVKERHLTMVGDRDREARWTELTGRSQTLELSEGPKFAFDYLMKVGGWKPA